MNVNFGKYCIRALIFIFTINISAEAQTYIFGDTINPVYSWKNNYNGWYAQAPANCNFSITAVNPQAFTSLTDTDSLEFQIFRMQNDPEDNGIQHPIDTNSTQPRPTYYQGRQGYNNETDFRVQGGNWFGIVWRYRTKPTEYSSFGDNRYDWHPKVIIKDRNKKSWPIILKACFFDKTLPMDTSSLIYYFGYVPGLTINYALTSSITTVIISGKGTILPVISQYPSLPKDQVWYNGNQDFIITADSTEYISDIVQDNFIHYGYQESPYNLNLTSITKDKNFKVYFGYQVQLIQRGASINASGYPTGFQYFPADSIISFDIQPIYEGSKITKIIIQDRDNSSTTFSIPIQNNGTGQTVVIGNESLPPPFNAPLNMNYKLTAEANIPIYVSAGPHGTVSNEGTNYYKYSSSTFILITPDKNYGFEHIYIDSLDKIDANGNSLDPNLVIVKTPYTVATYTFTNITSPRYLNVTFRELVGVNDIKPILNPEFELSNIIPMPASNDINITLTTVKRMNISIELFDINGRYITNIFDNKIFEPGKFVISIPLNKIATGEYILEVQNEIYEAIRIFSIFK